MNVNRFIIRLMKGLMIFLLTTTASHATAKGVKGDPNIRNEPPLSTLTVGKNRVTFESEGLTLVGHLYLPKGYEEGVKLPAVVVGGSWTTVKEQMAGLYAAELTKRGFVTLAFDHRFFGESEGAPRNYESPANKIVDFKHAIGYLQTLPMVDHEHIGALGVCASAGYLAHVAAEDERLRALVTVAAWMHEPETISAVYGAEGVRKRMEAGMAAREKYDEKGEVVYVPAHSTTDESAAMYGDFDYYGNPERGAIPEWDNRFAVMSWPEWLTFNPIAVAGKIKIPTLVIHSDQSALPQGAEKFFRNLGGAKSIYWTEGTHFDFYDKEPHVALAANHAALHFSKHLKLKGFSPCCGK